MVDTNPEIIGPGYWNYIHQITFLANTEQKQLKVKDQIYEICEIFPCKKCKIHFAEYLKQNDIDLYIGKMFFVRNKRKMNSLFIYMWKFHNCVNKRLGKKLVEFEDAYNMYENIKSCSKECMLSK